MIDSSNRNSIEKIVKTIEEANLSQTNKALFVSECLVQKLMITNMLFVTKFLLSLVYKFKGYNELCNVISVSILPDVNRLFENVLQHILNSEYENIAGGFNQEELYILQSILTHYKVYI